MGRASSVVFLRSVVYDQLAMRGGIERRRLCGFTGERVDCNFRGRHLREVVLKKSLQKNSTALRIAFRKFRRSFISA